MKFEIDPEIQADSVMMNFVRHANEILKVEVRIGRSWDDVSASWTLRRDENDLPILRLELSDWSGRVEVEFPFRGMFDLGRIEDRMIRLYGDLLEIRSHKLLESRGRSESSDRHLDGPDALDRIIDSVADYSEREGHDPKSLRLPVRYATALMKLGPAYWGDFYPRIRESGLRAFDGQTLLGMKVELVPGADAELNVA